MAIAKLKISSITSKKTEIDIGIPQENLLIKGVGISSKILCYSLLILVDRLFIHKLTPLQDFSFTISNICQYF